jgi:ABC-type transport system involved in multi-copper enzyme maturation permease subunit
MGLAIMLATYVATEFTYGVPEKVALDFGLGLLNLSSLGVSLFMGATLLSKEIESRTVYMVISRPVPRWVFIVGKLLGLLLVLFLNILLLSIMTIGCSSFLGGKIDSLIFYALGFIAIECTLLLLVVVLFSLFSNTIIASVMSLVLLILGHAIKETQSTSFVMNRGYLKKLMDFYHLVLPGFYKLNLKDYVLYENKANLDFIPFSLFYGIFYSLFLFFLIIFIFNKKNLD